METQRIRSFKYKIGDAPWYDLHAEVLEEIFKKLPLGDRIRAGSVCRYWNLVLSQAKHDILRIPDAAPWQILSEDHYHGPDQKTQLAEVSFRSLTDERIYRFRLPDDRGRGYLCGSSHGWLLMATAPSGSVSADPHLFLWNPLSGSTRDLPRMSAHPCYNEYRVRVCGLDITRAFERVTVFSPRGSAECVVAVILNKRFFPRNQISFCTLPRDKKWTTFGDKEDDKAIFVDVMYLEKTGSLYCLLTGAKGDQLNASEPETLRSRREVCLSGRTVPVRCIFLDGHFRDAADVGFDDTQRSLTLKRARRVFRLVEDAVHEDGDVLVVATDLDRGRFHLRRTKEVMVRDRIGGVTVMVPFDEENRFEELTTGIGDRTVFLGSACTDSIVRSNPTKGIETDCVYLATDDSVGYNYSDYNSDKRSFFVREHGVYSLKSRRMKNRKSLNVRYYTPDKIGWFEPKIFLK